MPRTDQRGIRRILRVQMRMHEQVAEVLGGGYGGFGVLGGLC